MLMMDADGHKWLTQLSIELAWLREHHPEKTALIDIAESRLGAIRAAGSTDSFTVSKRGKYLQALLGGKDA